jgi:hypothetical protein
VSPVATYTFVLLAGLALSAWAFGLLVHRDTGSWIAALVAGSAVAFNAHHLVRLVHIQALHLELVPLVFFAIDRLLATGRARYAVLLGASLGLQATASIYLLVFTGWAAACAWLARMPEWRQRVGPTATWILIAGATCALVLLPVLWPYVELAQTRGMLRNLGDTRRCAATWTDYLYTGSHLHYGAWSRHFNNSVDASFPGIVVTALAVFGLIGPSGRSPRARMWLAVVLGSILLSVMPRLPGFAWLFEHVPGMGAIRCYSRAAQMALVGMAVLAGYGTAQLLARLTTARAALVTGGLLIAAINAEALRAPLLYREYRGVPAVYDRLRDEPHAVVVELPIYERRSFFGNSGYMLNAIHHRHPIVNGYSGFVPRDFEQIAQSLRTFPSDEALETLHKLGVTHVVVHPALAGRRPEMDASPLLRLMTEQNGIAIYRFVSR